MSLNSSEGSDVPPRYVFVYGTLRKGDVRDINRLTPRPNFVGAATVRGTLYHLGSYPGLVLGGNSTVQGEVYEISAELENVLDEIEEVWPQQSGEYSKRESMVQMSTLVGPVGPAQLCCLLYEIAHERIVGKLRIQAGDWLNRGTASSVDDEKR